MKFSQNFIAYHGCGKCYLDGTNEIAYYGCSNKTFNPFWKNPIDVNNKISKSTRSQVKKKPQATRKYVRMYFNYLLYLKNKDTQSSSDWTTDYDTDLTDYESDTDTETNPEAETAQIQNSNLKPELTGENLIIDNTKNNVKTEADEVLVIKTRTKSRQHKTKSRQQITKRHLTINHCNTLKLIIFYHLHFYSYIPPLSFHKSRI